MKKCKLMDVENKIIEIYTRINMDGKIIPLKKLMGDLEKKIMIQVLSITKGNQRKASDILGVRPSTLNEKIKKYRINLSSFLDSKI